MSNKNKLAYEAQEPAFLRRLRAGQNALDGRSNVQIGRPQKSRLKTSADDEEDEPLIVDESGDFVGKKEWEGRLEAEAESKAKDHKTNSEAEGATSKDSELHPQENEPSYGKKQKIAAIGGPKKRKAIKVIGGEDEQGDNEDRIEQEQQVKSMSEATESLRSTVKDSTTAAKKDAESAAAQPKKKKVKKMKLSFDPE